MKKVVKKEPTIGMVLKAVDGLAISMSGLHDRLGSVENRLGSAENRLVSIEKDVKKMVTRDHFDRTIADLRGEMVALVRKEDNKVRHIAGVLNEKDIFDDTELRRVYEMEPFPEPVLRK